MKAYLALDRFRAGAPFRPVAPPSSATRPATVCGPAAAGTGSPTGPLAAFRGGATRATTDGRRARAAAARRSSRCSWRDAGRGPRRAGPACGDDERRVVACRYLLGLSESETCGALGIPPGTAKSRLHRALRRMREPLEAAGVTLEAVP